MRHVLSILLIIKHSVRFNLESSDIPKLKNIDLKFFDVNSAVGISRSSFCSELCKTSLKTYLALCGAGIISKPP
ncbi:hypothetical protein T12_5239 [Trichinella patagoniensis]|uniref:Uncharacterized protein n=1 Tax=Trichinella patagoniensis TaxID=990121 RepID=A0A0V0ZH68_9BILA|nr:hypothetical protein T12_5239 [Trichinella patagoniensis]